MNILCIYVDSQNDEKLSKMIDSLYLRYEPRTEDKNHDELYFFTLYLLRDPLALTRPDGPQVMVDIRD